MTSGCLDRKEVRGAIWGVHSTTDRPASGNTGHLFLAFGGPVCADRISYCPLDRVLTYKNLIYLLNLKFASISLTVRDRAISSKFSTHRVSKECTLCNFQKIFPSPKMAAILIFRIFAKNGKTHICFYLLNRAR